MCACFRAHSLLCYNYYQIYISSFRLVEQKPSFVPLSGNFSVRGLFCTASGESSGGVMINNATKKCNTRLATKEKKLTSRHGVDRGHRSDFGHGDPGKERPVHLDTNLPVGYARNRLTGGSGGTGRRAAFRAQWASRPCGFKSLLRHQVSANPHGYAVCDKRKREVITV